ncbi:acyltransferase [Aquabacterium sp.]|uniref:acyltransferase family protein n=1 Tax=Aquabacterium sp. TaxID=1872578 RepID=UPI002E340EDC|nr:acyltransferase [Aquabacterium sp.]HEX5311184.1 acyltransferase [Aquabacterium sp.]
MNEVRRAVPEAPTLDSGHIAALDGLRALAILLVMPHNLRLVVAPEDLGSKLLNQVLDRGWIGVQLFFVLSGFLITRILIRAQNRPHSLRGFYWRRGLRIWPLYYATLFLLLIVLPSLGWLPPHHNPQDIFAWTFLINLTQPFAHEGIGLPHLWSLAVEEQFYLLWPLLIRGASPRRIVHICLGLALTSMGVRWGMLAHGWPEQAAYVWTPCRMDALALGGAVAALLEWPQAVQWLKQRPRLLWMSPWAFLGAGALASRGYSQFGAWPQIAGYSLLATGFAALILYLVAADFGWVPLRLAHLRGKPLRTIAQYSYGMYMVHSPLGSLWLQPLARKWGWAHHPSFATQCTYLVMAMCASMAAGALTYHAYEQYFLRLKSQWD